MKQKAILIIGVCAIAAGMVLQGCQYTEDNPRTTQGAAVGAAAGGVIGAATQGTKGAVVGAVLGALAGGAVGQYMDRKERDADETKEAFGYDPATGRRLEPVSLTIQPDSVRAGGTMEITSRYAVLAPNDDERLDVVERIDITFNGARVANTSVEVVRTPGTYASTVPIRLPDSAEPGTYTVNMTMTSPSGTAEQNGTFRVTR